MLTITSDIYIEHYDNKADILMATETFRHNLLNGYFYMLLNAYFELKPIGMVVQAPFLLQLPEIDAIREPDLLVLLNSNVDRLSDTACNGAADICIEIISQETNVRDRGDKFEIYEKGGVGECWMFDYLRNEAMFYRLNKSGIYMRQNEDAEGDYRSATLPGLKVNVPTLWRKKLPGPNQIAQLVEAMLKP